MEPVEEVELSESLPIEDLRAILREAPVRFAILFGSRATGRLHGTSDIDIAVELESVDRESPAYNEVFLGLSADLSDELGTDDVDLVDIQTLSPAVADAVLDHGVVLVGDPTHAEETLQRIRTATTETRTARERFDAALGKIDDHLGDDSAVPATDGSRGER